MTKHVAIVGAGMGGLAAGLRLAHRGCQVTIFEKTGQVGGRNRRLTVGSSSFDAGPTLVMMLQPFRKLFADVGERIEDRLELGLCEPGYRVFYADGSQIDTSSNRSKMFGQVASISSRDASRLPYLMSKLEALYASSIPNFVEKNYYSALDFFGPRQLLMVAKHRMLDNLGKRIERTFEDPRIQMLFSFQTMYLGLSPYHAPWVYATLAYMEFGEGIWYPLGGVARISEAISEAAVERGVDIRLNSPVSEVRGNEVVLESGERFAADAILCNADLPYARRELLRESVGKLRNSCSAYVIYADYLGDVSELLHHNVFFGSDFRHNLRQIFDRAEIPDEPAFYVAVSTKSEPSRSEKGHSNLMVLIPCPNLSHAWTAADAARLQDSAFQRLERTSSFDRKRIMAMRTIGPEEWQADLNLDKGAAFGISHHLLQSAYFRPSNRSRSNPRVYYVGASTIPGNGMPMVLISADLAVQRMVHDGVV